MTRIKICGLTRPEDVELAADAGADFLGFNLYRKSPRFRTAQEIAALIAALPPTSISVGIFVHGAPDDLVCAELARVAWVQIHATPPGWTSDRIARPVIRAIAVDGPLDASRLTGADYWILDAPQKAHGGGGKGFDLAHADGLRGNPRVFVAGGLTPDNVGAVVRRLRPYAVDVASGCESSPGIKDPGKVRAFVQAVRDADADRGAE